MSEKWRTWVEIHPETAERLRLAAGDQVEVETPRGRLILPVKIYGGLMPGVIAIPFGLGHRSGGRWCKGIGENPGELVDGRLDPLTGRSLWTATRASVRKA
jgi:molybdopterin-containing oxidoreductase family iron-sulfur binding subunit